MRHSSHSSTDGCLDDMMDHMLWACAAAAQQSKQQLDSSVGAPDEAALHEGYVSLLKAARESFERQKSNMRCSEWAREIRNPGVAHHTNKSTGICSDTGSEGGDVVLVSSSPRTDIFEQQGNVLRKQSTEGNCNSNFGHPSNLSSPDSSSSSSLLPSDLSLPEATSHDITQHQIDRPFGRAGSGRRASNLYGQPQNRLMRELQTSNPRERGVQGQEKILSCPNYASMPLDRLKAFAAAYGLRTNTPKRLLVHQLTEIWEQTHKKQPSSSDTVEIEGRSRTGLQASVDLLHEQLRQYIRGNTGIYEQIVCYQVLDFDAVYAIIAKHVPCQMWMLRKFFDAEGIVYSSYHD
ncbi:hypothetical protein GQ54DRAFT_2040 [Martensiomyces pterosporus]|nr:hypothetical protein GQ54DRAFT_2040 [Martensiomyces pterosporus]